MTFLRDLRLSGWLGITLFALILCSAIFGPWLAPYDPLQSNAAAALQPPSGAHWFGTDQLGRDLFSRVVVAARLDLTLAFSAVGLSASLGSLIGAAIGYRGGIVDGLTSRVVDVLMAFPLFVLALALVAALGNRLSSVIYATALINLPFYIRLARAETRARRNLAYIEAARIGGASGIQIVTRFLLPNIRGPLIVLATVNLGWAVLNTAGLSFLGLGIRPPTPEWGIMVAEGARFITSGEWWVAFFPSLALMLTVLAFNLLGDRLRDVLTPGQNR